MPTDLGVNQESVERIIRVLTDGVIFSDKPIVMLAVLAVLRQESPKAGLGFLIDNAKERIEKALSELSKKA